MPSWWKTKQDRAFNKAQRAYDTQEPPEYYESDEDDLDLDECEICIFQRHGICQAKGETKLGGDCPSFKD